MGYIRCDSGEDDTPVLLWTNPNPTSNFAAQTVAVDVRNYHSIGFLLQNRVDQAGFYQTYIIRQKPIGGADALGVSNDVSNPSYPQVRGYTINSSNGNIVFKDSKNTYDASTGNMFNIPLKIYGYIKDFAP